MAAQVVLQVMDTTAILVGQAGQVEHLAKAATVEIHLYTT
jgi:hypothetical protein